MVHARKYIEKVMAEKGFITLGFGLPTDMRFDAQFRKYPSYCKSVPIYHCIVSDMLVCSIRS